MRHAILFRNNILTGKIATQILELHSPEEKNSCHQLAGSYSHLQNISNRRKMEGKEKVIYSFMSVPIRASSC